MDQEGLSEKVRRELEEIARRKGHLLIPDDSGDQISLNVINEFLKYSRGEVVLHRNLLGAIILISNHLIGETVTQALRDLKLKSEKNTILSLYLNLHMSSNFVDGFLLGHSFLKVMEGKDVTAFKNQDVLDIFKRVYLIRAKHRETTLVRLIDSRTGLIAHFEKAYHELFVSSSALLKNIAKDSIEKVVKYLVLTFFDGILLAMVLAEDIDKKEAED